MRWSLRGGLGAGDGVRPGFGIAVVCQRICGGREGGRRTTNLVLTLKLGLALKLRLRLRLTLTVTLALEILELALILWLIQVVGLCLVRSSGLMLMVELRLREGLVQSLGL